MRRERIPRPLRACLWALLAILVAIIYYIALGCPATFRQEFRRAEKAHMVGPSKIVDQVHFGEYPQFDKMLVGETEYGICFFGKQIVNKDNPSISWTEYRFQYVEKTGDVTFSAAPNITGSFGLNQLPVYVFTEQKAAVRCSIIVHTIGSHDYFSNGTKVKDPFDETFQAEAERDPNGFFRFNFTANTDDRTYALYSLSNLCQDGVTYNGHEAIIRIKLLDAQGNELLTQDMHLGSSKTTESDS